MCSRVRGPENEGGGEGFTSTSELYLEGRAGVHGVRWTAFLVKAWRMQAVAGCNHMAVQSRFMSVRIRSLILQGKSVGIDRTRFVGELLGWRVSVDLV